MFKIRNKKRSSIKIDEGKLPSHIAVIPDGNGRWAGKRGLPRSMGHREGANTLKSVARICSRLGISYLTAYAFSTENWTRPEEEVKTLMTLLLEFLKSADKELEGSNIQVIVIGDISRLSDELRREIARVTANTASNTGLKLVFALNYGGRAEILQAVRSLAADAQAGRTPPDSIDERLFSSRLYTSGMPDPDIIIRTSGEMRSSNFLLWQSAYSEFWFTDVLWPDFGEKDLMAAIADFQGRTRRYGGI